MRYGGRGEARALRATLSQPPRDLRERNSSRSVKTVWLLARWAGAIAYMRTCAPAKVRLRGMPYGWFTFARADALCEIFSDGRTVFAIDASLAANPPEGQGEQWQACIDRLRDLGHVVLCHSGSAEQYAHPSRWSESH